MFSNGAIWEKQFKDIFITTANVNGIDDIYLIYKCDCCSSYNWIKLDLENDNKKFTQYQVGKYDNHVEFKQPNHVFGTVIIEKNKHACCMCSKCNDITGINMNRILFDIKFRKNVVLKVPVIKYNLNVYNEKINKNSYNKSEILNTKTWYVKVYLIDYEHEKATEEIKYKDFMIVDLCTWVFYRKFKWYAPYGSQKYAFTRYFMEKYKTGHVTNYHMLVIGYNKSLWSKFHDKHLIVDHINQEKLINTFDNFRLLTHAENMKNIDKRKNSNDDMKGISEYGNRWKVTITADGETFYEYTDTLEQAVRIRKVMVMEKHMIFPKDRSYIWVINPYTFSINKDFPYESYSKYFKYEDLLMSDEEKKIWGIK